MKTSKKTYIPALRKEAVKLVLCHRPSNEQAAARASIPKGTLAFRVVAAKRGPAVAAAPESRFVADLKAEKARLRKELAETTMERVIVKPSHTVARGLMTGNSRRVHWMQAG